VAGLRLYLGCGPVRREGWVHIDWARGADLRLDLRRPLPFATGSCCEVYSEHFLEHLEYPDDAMALLRECYRVLAPGGIISTGVPGTEWPLREYVGVESSGYFEYVKAQWHPSWCQTRLEHINFHFRQGTQHRFAYDFETLAHALTQAGFGDIIERRFDRARDAMHRARGTLYVDGRKPVVVNAELSNSNAVSEELTKH
jgi:predicted SAM-dependent methyltransferase